MNKLANVGIRTRVVILVIVLPLLIEQYYWFGSLLIFLKSG